MFCVALFKALLYTRQLAMHTQHLAQSLTLRKGSSPDEDVLGEQVDSGLERGGHPCRAVPFLMTAN